MSEKSKKKETVESPEETGISTRPEQGNLSRGFDSIFDDFRRSFDYLMSPFLPMRTWSPTATQAWPVRAALVDLVDKGDKYLLRAELSGFEKDDIEILTNKDTITFRTEKKTKKEEKDQQFLHRENIFIQSKNHQFPRN